MMAKFKNAVIVRNEKNEKTLDASHKLKAKLERNELKVISLEDSNSETLAFVLGGDGTVLRASKRLYEHEVNVIGVNFGHLGFLSPYEFSEIDDILFDILVQGDYQIVHRNFLEVRNLSAKESKLVFNDFVVQRGVRSHMLKVTVNVDDSKMGQVLCDGMIFSTSTGSTAYNLSAGGSVIDPAANVISIVPMMAHAFSSWPVVVSSTRKIHVGVQPREEEKYFCIADGEKIEEFKEVQEFEITDAKRNLKFMCTKDRDFFRLVHRKLGWGIHNGCGANKL